MMISNNNNKDYEKPTQPSQSTIDYVQSLIESKLRQPFTSIDLTKTILTSIQTTNTKIKNNQLQDTKIPTSIRDYIQCLRYVFPTLLKPIKLRVLVSLLGFIPFIFDHHHHHNNTHEKEEKQQLINEIQSFLLHVSSSYQATKDDDKWMKIMSSIIHGKFYALIQNHNDLKKSHDEIKDNDILLAPPQIDIVFKKGIDKIISTITDNAQYAFELRLEAENKYMPNDKNTTSSTEQDDEKVMETFIDSFQIGTDVQPYYVPYHYKLCSSKLIFHDSIYSELNDRCDFQMATLPPLPTSTNNSDINGFDIGSCHILQLDELNDLQKAQEESKELEAIRIANERKINNTVVNMKITNRTSLPSSRENVMTNQKSSNGNTVDTASLMMRVKPSSTTSTTTKAGMIASSNTVTGGKTRKAGFGRGAAANSVGGKSLSIPSSGNSRSAMAAKALMRGRTGLVKPSSTITKQSLSTTSASRMAASRANKTKMKMIDVNEVQGLKKEGEERQKIYEEETRESRKRKIMERAAANGLVAKKRWGQPSSGTSPQENSDIKKEDDDNDHEKNVKRAKVGDESSSSSTPNIPTTMSLNQQVSVDDSNQQHPQQYQQQELMNQQNQMNWQQLLENSNKLSPEDRARVQQFFTTRINPTPDVRIYKTKLHEEKFIDPDTQQTVKETYYIELDYDTFGYKKVRKIKKK